MARYSARRRSLCPATRHVMPLDQTLKLIDEFRINYSTVPAVMTVAEFHNLVATAHVIADELETRIELHRRSRIRRIAMRRMEENLTET